MPPPFACNNHCSYVLVHFCLTAPKTVKSSQSILSFLVRQTYHFLSLFFSFLVCASPLRFSSRAGLAPERTYSAIEIPLQEQYYSHHYSLFTIALQAAALQISRSLQRSPKRLQRLWARSLQATLQVPRFCTTASEEISHYRRHSLVLQLRACTVPVARYSTVGKCSEFLSRL